VAAVAAATAAAAATGREAAAAAHRRWIRMKLLLGSFVNIKEDPIWIMGLKSQSSTESHYFLFSTLFCPELF